MQPSRQPPAADVAAKPVSPDQTALFQSNRATVNFGPISASEQAAAAAVMQIFRNPFRPRDLARPIHLAGSWLWQGYLGHGRLTLLTSQWKSGKTTLVSVLLARMATGGLLAGLPVAAGRAAVVSEEGPHDWHRHSGPPAARAPGGSGERAASIWPRNWDPSAGGAR